MNKILLLVVAFFIPPVAVALVRGFGFHFWLNILLWICGFLILGMVHGIFVVLTTDVEITKT